MEDIKNCPFCGGLGEITSTWSNKKNANYVFVECVFCKTRTKGIKVISGDEPLKSKAAEYAISLWNRRF